MKRLLVLLAFGGLMVSGCSSNDSTSPASSGPTMSPVVLPSVPTYTSRDDATRAVCATFVDIKTKVQGDRPDQTALVSEVYVMVKTAQQAQKLSGTTDTYAEQLYNASVMLRKEILAGKVETDGGNGATAFLGQLCR